jgi:hypothetical protein
MVAVYSERGGLIRGVRRSGQVIAKRGSTHSIVGHIKTGLTPREVAEKYRPGGRVEIHCDETLYDTPILSEAKAEARARAKARRSEREASEKAERIAEERRILGHSAEDAMLPLKADAESLVAYARIAQKNCAEDARLRYVVKLARFHGGAVSAWLGNAIGAEWVLPEGYQHRAQLDEIADAVAKLAFGSDMRAAAAWAPALGR